MNGLLYVPLGVVNAWAVLATRRRFAVAGGHARAPLVRTGRPDVDSGISSRRLAVTGAVCWAAVALMVASIVVGAVFNATALQTTSLVGTLLGLDGSLSIILIYTPLLVAVPSVFALDAARSVTASSALLAALRAAEPPLRAASGAGAAFDVAPAGQGAEAAGALRRGGEGAAQGDVVEERSGKLATRAARPDALAASLRRLHGLACLQSRALSEAWGGRAAMALVAAVAGTWLQLIIATYTGLVVTGRQSTGLGFLIALIVADAALLFLMGCLAAPDTAFAQAPTAAARSSALSSADATALSSLFAAGPPRFAFMRTGGEVRGSDVTRVLAGSVAALVPALLRALLLPNEQAPV